MEITKMMMNRQLKVSIVTVTYNAADCLEETILSVINQNDIEFEYIIIDGGSTDGTIEIIKKYASQLTAWLSEKDNGIYEAMNKGLALCSGEWVNFMNAGDLFPNHHILSKIFRKEFVYDADVIYGNHEIITGRSVSERYPQALKSIWKRMIVQHQSVFFRTALIKQRGYDTTFTYASDYDLLYYVLMRGGRFRYVNMSISRVTINGFSESNSVDTYIEYKKIALKYNPNSFLVRMYHDTCVVERKLTALLKGFWLNYIHGPNR